MTEPRFPDLIIGGAPRCGTTFLCEVLAKHPGIYVARPFIPEPKVLLALPEVSRDDVVCQRYADLFAPAQEGMILVEKSTHYLENEGARDLFRRLLPQTRMVFILRDPVARAFSNWVRSTSNGLETLAFEEAVAREDERSDPFPPERAYVRPFDYIARSRYGSLVKAWADALGSTKRLKVFQFEEMVEQPGPVLRDLQLFAGAAPLPWSEIATGVVNANEPTRASPDPAFATRLREGLEPEMRLLADLTGIDVSRWGF